MISKGLCLWDALEFFTCPSRASTNGCYYLERPRTLAKWNDDIPHLPSGHWTGFTPNHDGLRIAFRQKTRVDQKSVYVVRIYKNLSNFSTPNC